MINENYISVEDRSDALILEHLGELSKFSSIRNFVEIGLGTFGWTFPKIALNQAFNGKCLLAEPIISPELREIIDHCSKNTFVFNGVISNRNAQIDLYLNKDGCRDVTSINQDWWGVQNGKKMRVNALSWETFCQMWGIKSIAGLKLDVEGSELMILEQIENDLDIKVICFEYGEPGPWSDLCKSNIESCLLECERLGMKHFVMVDSCGVDVSFLGYEGFKKSRETIVKEDYGNIVCWKE